MPYLEMETKIKAVKLYLSSKSYVDYAQRWNVVHPETTRPSKSQLYKLLKRFNKLGTVENQFKHCGRRFSVRTPEMEAIVYNYFCKNPEDSIRDFLDKNDFFSRSSVHRILRLDLEFKPYRFKVAQQLQYGDEWRREEFCATFLHLIKAKSTADILSRLVFFDEAKFKMDDCTTHYNRRYWSEKQPNMVVEKINNQNGIMVLAGVSIYGIIGPFFFDNTMVPDIFKRITDAKKRKYKRKPKSDAYHPMPTNMKTFKYILRKHVVPEMKSMVPTEVYDELIPCFDGSPIHTGKEAFDELNRQFGDRWIGVNSQGQYPQWCPRSPDLSPMGI